MIGYLVIRMLNVYFIGVFAHRFNYSFLVNSFFSDGDISIVVEIAVN